MSSPTPNAARPTALTLLLDSLDEAEDLLRGLDVEMRAGAASPAAATLLQQCLDLCQSDATDIEPVRTIHHLSCTGGTLISKCVSAMPNVQMLSEVDPLSPLAAGGTHATNRFAPADMGLRLRTASRPAPPDTLVKLFRAELVVAHEEACRKGYHLVLRDHTHSHYLVGPAVPRRPSLRDLVASILPVRSVLTVRNPFDSFASLRNNQWVQFEPGTFDEYCRRYLCMLDAYADVPRVRYEDVLASPHSELQGICTSLELPYSECWAETFSAIQMTGDSGRKSDTLEPRPRRPESLQLEESHRDSDVVRTLLERMGYV